MKYWIINNTKFGYKNNSKEWIQNMTKYFISYFIPFVTKHAKPGDKIIHLGNIFNSTESINISTLILIKDLFDQLSNILPVIIVDGYNEKNGITKLFKSENVNNITSITTLDNIKIIPNKNPLEYISSDDSIVFINNRIDTNLLKKFPDTLFFCGYHDDRKEDENIIHIGSPYQLDKTTSDKGFYVLDPDNKNYKFVKNNYSPNYNTITITDISQIDEIDAEFVDKNHVSIVVDKALVDDKKIKIDVLLSKFNFKSITYKNDIEKIEFVDSSSVDMEELIREKIKNSDNVDLLSEFENIIRIYKEKY